MGLSDIVIDSVHSYINENGLDRYTLEELADLFCQCYYAAREVYTTDVPKETRATFVVAGRLSNGRLGMIEVVVGNDTAETEIMEEAEIPQTLFLAPADMTDEECNQQFQRAIRNANNKRPKHQDPLESLHRKAVRYISEISEFVGPKSDYLVIKP